MEKINFNLYKGGVEMDAEKKESFESILEIRRTISGFINSLGVFEKTIREVYAEGGFSYPSSRFKIKLLESVSGKTCSIEDLRKAEKAKPNFDKYLKKVFFKLNGVTELQEAKGLRKKSESISTNDMQKAFGYKADAKPYDPNEPKVGIEKQFKD